MKDIEAEFAEGLTVRRLEAGPSNRGFVIGIYLEHLEEASFLYEQRRDVLLDDPELAWIDIDEFEERLEAHLDGLVLGEDLALAVCRQQVEEGDGGELHAAVRVFCRQERKDLLDDVLDGLDAEDEERVQAVRDALRDELPKAWEAHIVEMLGRNELWRQHMAAHVIGYRRLQAPDALIAALSHVALEVLAELVWALGRLKVQRVQPLLYNAYLRHENKEVREAAALALLRLGEQAALRHLLTHERTRPWALRLVGISGTQSERRHLLDVVNEGGPAAAEALLALGLLGDPEAVDALIYHLEEPSLAGDAALGLYLITGADLLEEAFVPEEIDEDELFEDELEKVQRGEPLTRPDGEPLGMTVTRLSQDAETWRAWWNANMRTFQRGVRYRTGQACTPTVLVENLRSERLPRYIRQLTYEELVVRYGIDVPFETDMFVAQQKQALTQLAAQVQAEGRSFQEGRWYFAGRMYP